MSDDGNAMNKKDVYVTIKDVLSPGTALAPPGDPSDPGETF
jgi:hypothetical protein